MKKDCIIVFVPHQDDEINLIGNCWSNLSRTYNVIVVYSSIDSDKTNAKVRKEEAKKACSFFGVSENNIVFLDYPDTPNRIGSHYFTEGNKKIINDVCVLIEKYKPALIICNDFDYHSDHRVLSIVVETAIGRVVGKSLNKYKPGVLKGFCYSTAFCGVEDYFSSENGRTVVNTDNMDSPIYEWAKRISIPSIENRKFFWQKDIFKALWSHKSQYAALRAKSVMNCDNVFWNRRTDNLLLNDKVEINTSSGDGGKLKDFLITDSDDIFTADPKKVNFSKGVWKPDIFDITPIITIKFDSEKAIERLVLHGNPNLSERCAVSGLIIVNQKKFDIKHINCCGRDTIIEFEKINTREVKLQFDGYVELSEIEIFENKNYIPISDELLMVNAESENEYFLVGRLVYFAMQLFLKIKRKLLNLI